MHTGRVKNNKSRTTPVQSISHTHSFVDRDESTLAFNARVLDWARRSDVPLLERLRYLCIVSSNLDEFFEVRVALHRAALVAGEQKGDYNSKTFSRISAAAQTLVQAQYDVYNHDLIPAFAKAGIKMLSFAERNEAQNLWVKHYFHKEVKPLLVPVGLDPSHPFPQVANKSLNFIVQLSGKDAFGRNNEIAIVRVPRVLPRIIRLPDKLAGKRQHLFVSLSSVIRAHLQDLFPGRQVGDFSQFRVTRDSDLSVDEEDVKNLRTALRKELELRAFGRAVRLEVSSGCTEYLAHLLLKHFELPEQSLYRVHGPVNLVRLNQLIDLIDAPRMLFPTYVPSYPAELGSDGHIFSVLREHDVMVHQPFESFDGVIELLRAAVEDPNVLAIKQTVYRIGSDSRLMDLLHEAVRRGKEVLVVVELKARFDEEANINWAERLEKIGAQVVYGVVGLKTHSKMLLITRREGRQIRRYAHLSTGNYNAKTARLYTDVSHFTANAALTSDIEQVFLQLASQSSLPRLRQLWVAPFNLQDRLLRAIESTARASRKGLDGRIILKMNSLTDERLARALVKAGQAGVNIDLIVRGACILPAQVPGFTENIKVRSVIGRFLEHSRVFYFRANDKESLYLSSADWMSRNMTRRVELAWPVTDLKLRQRIIDECLVAYLGDTCDAWIQQGSVNYQLQQVGPSMPCLSAQQALMSLLGARS
jgi:polyphosphate kinase